jgi:hydrogenase large subunit
MDPITRIVGSLGIHTEIDFTNHQVMKCYSTSMVFRGFDIFMKGIDPRDAHFITSRICGICGDNHCTCSCLNQNMAYGVKPPKLGDYAYNLAESADFMFDHAIFNDCMANVDFCEQMVKETNPTLLKKAEETAGAALDIHGYKTIADIMRALNPFTGSFYLETLQVARYTREMYCLFGGRHTHPSTIMPGGVSAHITHQTCTDYYVRLMRYIEYVKRTVPMHDDLYDFFLQELPGYDMVGYRDTDLCAGAASTIPDYVDYSYKQHGRVGQAPLHHAGPRLQGRADHHRPGGDQPRHAHPAGQLVLRRLVQRGDVRHPGPARQPGRQAPSVEQGHAAQAAEARLGRQVQLGRVAAHVRRAQRHLRRL